VRSVLVFVLALAVAVPAAYAGSTIRPLTAGERTAVMKSGNYHRGCPVPLSRLRVLTVRMWGFDHRAHRGQLIVNARYARGLQSVFAKLLALRFPVRHMRLSETYGGLRPRDGDVTASFECRQASASPCTGPGNKRTGTWSNHAYGLAVDLNPVENPYVGCGQTRDPRAVSYMNRSHVRPGMVTRKVVRAFASIGWKWGGAWTGTTKDYMHFSWNGH
jgi:D-alanyl-D-alanine carboxypeptidase